VWYVSTLSKPSSTSNETKDFYQLKSVNIGNFSNMALLNDKLFVVQN